MGKVEVTIIDLETIVDQIAKELLDQLTVITMEVVAQEEAAVYIDKKEEETEDQGTEVVA